MYTYEGHAHGKKIFKDKIVTQISRLFFHWDMLTYIDYDIKMLYTICTSIVYLKKFLKIDLVTIITPTTKVLYRSPTSRTPPEYCHITTTKQKRLPDSSYDPCVPKTDLCPGSHLVSIKAKKLFAFFITYPLGFFLEDTKFEKCYVKQSVLPLHLENWQHWCIRLFLE